MIDSHDIKEYIRNVIVYLVTLEAKAVIRKYKPKIVMITGSVGKTSAKDAIYTAFSGTHPVRRSEKSFNSDIGVPLTILGVPNGWGNPVRWVRNLIEGLFLIFLNAPYPAWLVVEIGADRPGDITRSLSWLKPDVVVATRFPDVPVHVEFYASPEEVVAEELAPIAWLKEGGIAVLNADDPRASGASIPAGASRLLYGSGAGADIRTMRYMVTSRNRMPTGIAFDVYLKDEKARVTLPGVVGKTHMQAVVAGIASAVAVGIPLDVAAARFTAHVPPPGRTRLIGGRAGSVIIDDTYNSSPVACEEALRILAGIPRTGRRIAVLADMLELGPYSVSEHQKMGAIAAVSSDLLFTAGVRARGIAEGARLAGMSPDMVIECERGEDVIPKLLPLVEKSDVILIKGSQSTRMERVVKALMHEPLKAGLFLVRQDAEWLTRA